MEAPIQSAPPVVAVVVVHEPGDWFAETIDAFVEQDYPNLRFLFLITPDDSRGAARDAALHTRVDSASEMSEMSVEQRIDAIVGARLESAFVRTLETNDGFGSAANEVLRLVEGANGFFLFCHDDIAPDPDAIRVMVEELYRSNAGAVGPKIVDWDDPGILLSVGLGLDRFGEIDQAVEPDEVDQEQHDGVRDVFVLPTACMLVRADLFRELGGFDDTIELIGEDVEFCWRAHHSGARVVVAPIARVRHRGELEQRRPDLNLVQMDARHRLRTVATMTGAARLPGRVLELVLLTFAELVVGLFTGRFRQAFASLRSLIGLVTRIPSLISRRRQIAPLRRVPEREVLGLQQRGSARLNSFLRSRDTATYVGADTSVRRWRESTTAPVIAWIAVLVMLLIGSRSFFSGAVPEVGQFLPFPESPRELFGSYLSGWNPTGFGATSPNPTGWAALSALSFVTLFRMGLLQTVFVIGLVVVGLVGLWKLATVFPSTRARIAALVVYAASPLVGGALAIGALDVLIAFAAVPWMVHTLRRAAGLETADPESAPSDIADGVVDLAWPERLRRTIQFALVVGLAAAFEPVLFVVAAVIGLLLAVGTLLALAPWKTAVGYGGVTLVGLVVAALLNLPWISSWSWDTMVGPSPIGDPGRGVFDLASFQIGPAIFGGLTLAWYLPVVAALLLARAWRLTWAVRGGVFVVGFGALAVFGDRGSLPVTAPTAGVLLVPVAAGLAIAAAAALAAFDLDVRGGSFGWRQPLGIAASLAVIVGVVPGVVSVGPGDWDAPSTPLLSLIEARLEDVPDDGPGDYHALLLGDARILPAPAIEYRDGVSFAVISDDDLDIRSRWAPTTEGNDAIIDALNQIAAGSTQRAGRLLAPLGIRYIVVPEIDGVVSTSSDPLDQPLGLVDALDKQLDIVSEGLPTVEVFENTSWLPTYSFLTGPTAEASRAAGDEALVGADLTSAQAVFSGADARSDSRSELTPGVVHLAVPFDEHWRVDVDGRQVPPRPAFGTMTAFDIDNAGSATLSYETAVSRSAVLVFQAVLWVAVLFVAMRVSLPFARRRRRVVTDETLITLDDPIPDGVNDVGPPHSGIVIDPGLDVTGQAVARDGATATAIDDTTTLEAGDEVIDELPWINDLIEESVADPIGVVRERVDEASPHTSFDEAPPHASFDDEDTT